MSARNWLIVLVLGLGLALPVRADDAAPKKDDAAAKKDEAKKDEKKTDPAKPDPAKKDDKKPEMKKDDKKGDAKKGDAMKKDEKKDKADPKEKKPTYIPVGAITGQITQMGEGGGTLTVRVTGVLPTWVQSYDPRYGRWRVNPNYNQPNVISNDFDVILADDCKIRIPPKKEYDEKGRVKPPPKKDPKEDPDYKMDGYKGEASDLAKEQIVRVQFGRSTDPKNPQTVATVIYVLQDKAGYKRPGEDK